MSCVWIQSAPLRSIPHHPPRPATTYDGEGVVAREYSAGNFALDSSYGASGKVEIGQALDGESATLRFFPEIAKVDDLGRIVACGTIAKVGGGGIGLAVWRVNGSGTRDATFADGKSSRILRESELECRRLVLSARDAIVLSRDGLGDKPKHEIFRVPNP